MPPTDKDQPTQQKVAEEVLRQVQLIVENSHDAIIGESLEGIVTSWNGGAEAMFGFTAEEMIGKSIESVIPPEIKQQVPVLLNKIKAGEFVADYDSVRFRKDGSKIDVAFSASPIKDKDGTVIGISVVERDITARKRAEESMRQVRLIVEHSHDAIIGQTLAGIVTSWNRGATKMFGYNANEMIGNSLVNLFPPELKDELPRLLEKVGRGEVVADYDSVWLRKDSTRADVEFSVSPVKADVEFSVSPVHGEQGEIIGASLVGRDITERKKNELHIKELNEVRNKFISIISHQLRTPLTAVNWNLETLLNGDFGKLEETQRKFLQVTHNASIEITRRIYDVITAMDIEEGRVRFEPGEVSLNSLCAGVVGEIAKKCELKNIVLTYTPLAEDLPVIDADGQKVRQAILAVLENSAVYTKESGKIIATLQRNGDVARLQVTDTGIGIPQAEQHLVFTRFFRASNAATMQPDSFGLGLFIAKSFLNQYHGRIGFESKEGTGSTFWIEIPLKNA